MLTKNDKEELASMVEWFLEDETDKEMRTYYKGLVEKLRNGKR